MTAVILNRFNRRKPRGQRQKLCFLRFLLLEILQSQIRDRLIGPDYFEVHAVAQDSSRPSTSRCVFVRPAVTSARPRRIAAMMRNSSAISSSEAFSGSLWRASSTACLSVMQENYPFAIIGATATSIPREREAEFRRSPIGGPALRREQWFQRRALSADLEKICQAEMHGYATVFPCAVGDRYSTGTGRVRFELSNDSVLHTPHAYHRTGHWLR
jgi:hypothetical protein